MTVISLMLAVPDAPAATAWYEEALGATPMWNLGGVVGLSVDGAVFFLGQPENIGWPTAADAGTPTVRVEVFVEDPDGFIARAVAAGAVRTVEPVRDHEAPWNTHRQGGFADPFGHTWLVGDRTPLGDAAPSFDGTGDGSSAAERRLAAHLFNGVWQLLDKPDRTADEDDRLLHMAHASRYHWGQVGTAENRSRGEWQCSRVYAALGRSEPALYHANRNLEICDAHGIGDFDLAFAYEALARSWALAGDGERARAWLERARAAAVDIAEDEDRELLLADLATIVSGRTPPS
jgi:uncharacterized glyoxalase superfamily protein PhnB